jgi:hypothetical protein
MTKALATHRKPTSVASRNREIRSPKLAGLNGEMKVLIPKKAMDEVEKLANAAGADAQIEFAKDESHRDAPARWRYVTTPLGRVPDADKETDCAFRSRW